MFQIHLFGHPDILLDGKTLVEIHSKKAFEIFCYLLVNRKHSHPRETLATLLWGESSTAQSKKYLRQAIWKLRKALHPEGDQLFIMGFDTIQVNPLLDLWADFSEFEAAYTQVQRIVGKDLNTQQALGLQRAVELYRGDLMEGWYSDWCLFERERLQNIYLIILDKLIAYCEAKLQHEAGLFYGLKALQVEPAREFTHCQMMRLYYLSGDRTAALQQYGHCVLALQSELGVRPAQSTTALYESIRDDRLNSREQVRLVPTMEDAERVTSLTKVVHQLSQLQILLEYAQNQIIGNLNTIEQAQVKRR